MWKVLILVVVEDGLGGIQDHPTGLYWSGLNPCCSGRWSRREGLHRCSGAVHVVLILVVVEDGLGDGLVSV